jgi:uncharacterized protein (DUF924 family)
VTAASADNLATPSQVIAFWQEAGPDKWFNKDEAFDADIRRHFLSSYEAAAAGRLAAWEATAEGALALTLLLDQFPRNMFRGSTRTYAADAVARAVADRSLSRGYDRQVPEALGHSSFCPSCTRKISPTRSGVSRSTVRPATSMA